MKVYNEKETAEILKMAAENSHKDVARSSAGLTIDELEHIALESGINPGEIRKAASELELQSRQTDSSFWGGPFSFFEQFQIDHEISVDEWEDMLILIREFFKTQGVVNQRESVVEWTPPWGASNSAHVTAVKQQAKTRVSVGWNGPMTALPFYIPIPLVGIASLLFASEFLGLSSVPGLSFTVLSIGLTFAAGRWALRRHMKKGLAKLHTFVEGLQQGNSVYQLSSHVSDSETNSIENQDQTTEPLLDLDLTDIETVNPESIMAKRSKE